MEKPYTGRATVRDDLANVRITIPARRSGSALLFVSCWLVGWACGEFFALRSLANEWRGGHLGSLFLIVWLACWTVGGLMALRALLWGFGGKEIITVGQGVLMVGYTWAFLTRPKSYDLQDVKSLRVQDPAYDEAQPEHFKLTSPRDPGTIRFDYGLQTISFASGIDEAEANYLLAMLRTRRLLTGKNFS